MIRKRFFPFQIVGLLCAVHLLVPMLVGVEKPIGTFSASGASGMGIYGDPELRGVLVRADWAAIEPTPGNYNFAPVLIQANNAIAQGKSWSLAIAGGGVGSPAWLIDLLGAPYVGYSFRGDPGYRLPLFWNQTVQARLALLANALGAQFNGNANLKLVYVTQMTSNGIEGHLQGVSMPALAAAGYTDAAWVQASKTAARSFANAFPDKALAFEVHEVNGGATVPASIINDLWNDPTLGQRVGAGMWWISGKTSYQPDLIAVLTTYPGDIYGQVIGRSDQSTRFENGDYTTVFTQAMQVGMRYIEPWEFDFKTGPNSANGAWDTTLAAFNAWADATYGVDTIAPAAPAGLTATGFVNAVALDWDDNTEPDLAGYLVHRAETPGGPYADLPPGLLTESRYLDTSVPAGAVRYYVVSAVDGFANESAPSTEVSAVALPPVTVAFGVTDDTYVKAGQNQTGYGSATKLHVRDGGKDRTAFLKFDLGAVTRPVLSATLRLKCAKTGDGATTVYRVSDTSWTEATVTAGNQPARGAVTASAANVDAEAWIAFDVTGAVTGGGPIAFAIDAGENAFLHYYAKEAGDGESGAVLEITW